MRLILESRFALFGMVAVALVALFGLAAVTRSLAEGTRTGEPVVAPVESTLRVCPPPQGDDRDSKVAAFARPTGRDGGSLEATENTDDATSLGGTDRAGRVWTEDVGDTDHHTVVRGDSALAAGLEVTQATLGADDPYATEARCAEPGTGAWFAAPGGDDLTRLRLFLANVDGDTATANVDLYASDGPAYSTDTRGISVGAHDDAEVELTDLIEATDAVAVRVRTNAGRVASALLAERSSSGTDWVPPTTAPATRQVVPGVPDGGGTRRLVVATTGDEPATARARVYTPDGEVDHDALKTLDVPPAASTRLSLEGPLAEQPGTVVVESDRPVVVGVAMDRPAGDDRADTAYAAAARPLRGPVNDTAVLPADPKGTTSQLLLGAPKEPAEVRVTPVADDGSKGRDRAVRVKKGHTAAPDLDTPKGTQAMLVTTAGGADAAPVYAGRVLTQDSGKDRATAARPVLPAPTEVVLPEAHDSLTSVVRR